MSYLPVDIIVDQKAKQKHLIETLNLLAYVVLLVIVLVTTWLFKRKKRLYIHETGLAIIYGLIMGAILRYGGLEITIKTENLKDNLPLSVPADYIMIKARNLADKNANQSHIYAYEFRGEVQNEAQLGSQISYASVDPEVFFNIILPPIVLNAGLSLKRRHFFRNIGAIFSYAFIGTTISVAFVGASIYGTIQVIKTYLGYAYLADEFSLSNCLYFGAIISPTDPLAVLAIFQELGVDVNLFALVFGESILNDAVSIVLTHSIDQFSVIYARNPYHPLVSLVWQCVYNFLTMFLNSCLIGIVIGIVTALTTKFTKLTDTPLLETSLVVLMSYSAFLCAEVMDASGIVAVLLCGITQAHYTINNLSFEARERIKNLFELLTFLCENFLFLAVGVAFWQRNQTWNLPFIGMAFVAVTFARAVSIYPLTVLLNLGRRHKIPCNFQHIIAWGGAARGVISYSLAAKNTVGDARRIMLSTTSVIVIFSVIAVGGAVEQMLRFLRIPFNEKGGDDHDKVALTINDGSGQAANRPYQVQLDQYGRPEITANDPGWLVRRRRLHRSISDASLVNAGSQTPQQAGNSKLHYQRHHLPVSANTTPILEVDAIWINSHHYHRQQQQQRAGADLISDLEHSSSATSTIIHHGGQEPLPMVPETEDLSGLLHGAGDEDSRAHDRSLPMEPGKMGATFVVGAGTGSGTVSSPARTAPAEATSNPSDLSLVNIPTTTTATPATATSNLAPTALNAGLAAPYENASLVRRWRNLDNKFIKPLLTNSQPTLMETLPPALGPLARWLTSDEQLMRCGHFQSRN